jgi:DNA polymerase V
MQESIVALIDCDSFYVSVEKVFDPSIRNIPVVVLSNNDGCVVSACPIAKKIGAKTGVPFFDIKKDLAAIGGVAYSANYTLYGDFSARFVTYVLDAFPDVELYSVDEVFINIKTNNINETHKKLSKLRLKILKELGFSVSVGVSRSKTLAKVATKKAKKIPERIHFLIDAQEIKNTLSDFPVGDIWGIGHASTTKLKILGIRTAWQLTQADNKLIQKTLTIVGRRTQDELRGIPSVNFKLDPNDKKEITTTRSFLGPVYELEDIERALSDHIFNASAKLRKTNQKCHYMYIFVISNHFKDIPQCYLHANIPLEQAEDSPVVLITKGLEALRKIFKWGYEFRKCGVILTDLRPNSEVQLSLFSEGNEKNDAITSAIDNINRKYGPRTVKTMSCSKSVPLPDKARRSKSYTTDINQLLLIKI